MRVTVNAFRSGESPQARNSQAMREDYQKRTEDLLPSVPVPIIQTGPRDSERMPRPA